MVGSDGKKVRYVGYCREKLRFEPYVSRKGCIFLAGSDALRLKTVNHEDFGCRESIACLKKR